MNVEWKRNMARHASGKYAVVGKWNVGYVGDSDFRPKGTSKKYVASCHLPGAKLHIGDFRNEENAEAAVEQEVGNWFKGLEKS